MEISNDEFDKIRKIREETHKKWEDLGFLNEPWPVKKRKHNMTSRFELDDIQFMSDYDQKGQWCVYILECDDWSLYTGITNDINNRLKAHRSGKGAKYTRGRLPVLLKAFHLLESKSEALKLEYKIKQMKKDKKIPFLKSLKDGKDK